MRAEEIAKYLLYTEPDLDLVVLDRKTYERLLKKAKTLDAIKDNMCELYKIVKRAE